MSNIDFIQMLLSISALGLSIIIFIASLALMIKAMRSQIKTEVKIDSLDNTVKTIVDKMLNTFIRQVEYFSLGAPKESPQAKFFEELKKQQNEKECINDR